MRTVACLLAITLSGVLAARADTPSNEVRAVLTAYQDGMADRNIAHVQKAVANEVIVIRDGAPSDGWEEYRDHRLIPQFAHTAPASHWEVVKLNASADIAWATVKTVVSAKGKGDSLVWTVFVLERRGRDWKIVLIDENPGKPKTASKRRNR